MNLPRFSSLVLLLLVHHLHSRVWFAFKFEYEIQQLLHISALRQTNLVARDRIGKFLCKKSCFHLRLVHHSRINSFKQSDNISNNRLIDHLQRIKNNQHALLNRYSFHPSLYLGSRRGVLAKPLVHIKIVILCYKSKLKSDSLFCVISSLAVLAGYDTAFVLPRRPPCLDQLLPCPHKAIRVQVLNPPPNLWHLFALSLPRMNNNIQTRFLC